MCTTVEKGHTRVPPKNNGWYPILSIKINNLQEKVPGTTLVKDFTQDRLISVFLRTYVFLGVVPSTLVPFQNKTTINQTVTPISRPYWWFSGWYPTETGELKMKWSDVEDARIKVEIEGAHFDLNGWVACTAFVSALLGIPAIVKVILKIIFWPLT